MFIQSTILVVDDQPANRLTLEALLSAEGYNLLQADSGAAAIAILEEHTVDLILLDVMMPDQDGYEVCRLIRSSPDWSDIPVVMVTALNDRQSRLSGIDAGADDFISKPFDKDELRARVKAITRLNRYRKLLAQSERVKYLESHDTLTGLLNRDQLLQRLGFTLDAFPASNRVPPYFVLD